ncbi:hypothetical protein IAQ61_007475 [Plenodomus lingam]|nr:hypothetical protein IAQ61_007475 [Plenodomus lingam]
MPSHLTHQPPQPHHLDHLDHLDGIEHTNTAAPPHPSDPLYFTVAPHDSSSQSPLTGHDANFLDNLLPAYRPDQPGSPCPFYNEARIDDYHAPTPPPPPPPSSTSNFLESILNPAGLDHGRYSPFVYRPSPPAPSRVRAVRNMPPNTRANGQDAQQSGRLSNGYVDLTATPDSPPRRRKRGSSSPGPSAKRARRNGGRVGEAAEGQEIEEVDLTDDSIPVAQVLQKQRLDAVKAQAKPEETKSTFNTFTCVICMDSPTDLSATACGHLFCHTCLMEALIAGENRAGPGETKRSQCPVCRKVLMRNKSTDVIPLLLMKGLATQPRKKVAVASAAAAAAKV